MDTVNTGLYKFEIQAEIDTNTFLLSKTLNPKLFVYEVDENDAQISDYIVQDFPIYSLYEESGEYEWLDILGMYIKIENLNSNFENNPFALVEFDEIIFSDTLLSDIIDVKMEHGEYSDMLLQPYFDYQIAFEDITIALYTSPPIGCNDNYDINGNTLEGFPINVGSAVVGSIIFSDFSADGNESMIVGTNYGNIYAYDSSLELLDYFPVNYQFGISSSPQIEDLDNDGDFEIIAGTSGDLLVVDIKSDYGDSQNNWSLFKGDWKRTGSYEYEGSSGGCEIPQIGDINCDQIINVIDIILLVNYILE